MGASETDVAMSITRSVISRTTVYRAGPPKRVMASRADATE